MFLGVELIGGKGVNVSIGDFVRLLGNKNWLGDKLLYLVLCVVFR